MCSLANKLRYLREQKGMTKKAVADAVGVHPSSIGNLEKGSIPQADLLFSLAQLFDVSMEYLISPNYEENKIESTQFQNLTSNDMTLLNLFDQLDERDQNEVLEIINIKILSSKRYRNKTNLSHSTSQTTETKMA